PPHFYSSSTYYIPTHPISFRPPLLSSSQVAPSPLPSPYFILSISLPIRLPSPPSSFHHQQDLATRLRFDRLSEDEWLFDEFEKFLSGTRPDLLQTLHFYCEVHREFTSVEFLTKVR